MSTISVRWVKIRKKKKVTRVKIVHMKSYGNTEAQKCAFAGHIVEGFKVMEGKIIGKT